VLTAGVNDVRGLAVSLDVALHPDRDDDRQWDAAAALVPAVLELLLDSPAGTVLSLNVPDRPAAELRELRHATLAPFGAVQARVDEVDDGHWHLQDVENDEEVVEGSDQALLAAGHPTLTALGSVREDSAARLPDRLTAVARTGSSAG
jgi:5'-nucleotidase